MTVMAQRGYERASIQEIAKAAELTPGLVHYHFGSKQQVLLALIERLRDTLRLRFEKRLREAGTAPESRLKAFIEAHLELGEDADPRATACWVAIGAEALRLPEVQKLYHAAIHEQMSTLDALCEDVLASSGRPTSESAKIAAHILSSIQGAYQLGLAAPAALPTGFASTLTKRSAELLLAQAE